jgi:hypothetical protein
MTTRYFNVKQGITTGNITIDATTGNITGIGNISVLGGGLSNLGNLATANFFQGDGGLLSNIIAGNISGQVANALVAGTVYVNAQPNITSLGTLSSLNVTGNISSGNANLGNLVIANYYQGTLVTGAQPNITSVGTLVDIEVTGNANIGGNVNVGGIIFSQGNITTAGTIFGNIEGNISGNIAVTGSNTNVLFNDDGNVGATNGFSFNKATNTVSITGNITSQNANLGNLAVANYFQGDGSLLTNITGGNVTGQVANALVAGTVYTNAQPNITSVGTLSSLDVTGNISGNNITANGNISVNNRIITPSATDLILDPTSGLVKVDGNLDPNAGGYSLGLGTRWDGIYANTGDFAGNVTVNNFVSNGNANVGTIVVSGDATITGNLTVAGNTVYANVETLVVEDPVIELGGGPNGAPLTTNDGKDRGTLLHYYTTAPIDAFMGWDNSNGEFGFGSNVTNTNEVMTFNDYGNIRASYFLGNGSALSSITGGNVTGQVANALVAGTVYTNAQPNITSVGTLASLNVAGNLSSGNANLGNAAVANFFIGDGSLLTNLSIANASVANANYAAYAGNVTIASQPNITSLGTLASLTVSGLITATGTGVKLANVQDPTGTVTLELSGGDLSVYNDLVVGSSGAGNITAYNANLGNLVIANYYQGTLTTNAQPNITSLGTLNGLTASATIDFTTASNVTLGSVGNLHISGGSNGQHLTTYGNGTLYWATVDTSQLANGNSNVEVYQNGNIAISSAGVENVAIFTDSAFILNGNLTSGNASLGNLATANYFSGNGSLLSSITGANVTGQVANALVASTVYSNAQPNITSVGTLTSLNVTGTATVGNVALNNGITSNRSNVAVTTNTVIDQFAPGTYRTAKYIISASGDDGFQSVETLLVHDGTSAYITIYGSICSNTSADIVELSSNINGVSGNVSVYATSASANALVNLVVTYIKT